MVQLFWPRDGKGMEAADSGAPNPNTPTLLSLGKTFTSFGRQQCAYAHESEREREREKRRRRSFESIVFELIETNNNAHAHPLLQRLLWLGLALLFS